MQMQGFAKMRRLLPVLILVTGTAVLDTHLAQAADHWILPFRATGIGDATEDPTNRDPDGVRDQAYQQAYQRARGMLGLALLNLSMMGWTDITFVYVTGQSTCTETYVEYRDGGRTLRLLHVHCETYLDYLISAVPPAYLRGPR